MNNIISLEAHRLNRPHKQSAWQTNAGYVFPFWHRWFRFFRKLAVVVFAELGFISMAYLEGEE